MIKYSFLVLIVFIEFVYANRGIDLIQDEMAKYNHSMTEVKAALKDIDFKITQKNTNYLLNLKKEELIQNKLSSINEKLLDQKSEIKLKIKKLTISYQNFLLSKFSPESVDSLLKKKLLNKQVEVEGRKLEGLLEKSILLQKEINELEVQVSSVISEKNELYSILKNLENERNTYERKFGEDYKISKELQEKVVEYKTKKILGKLNDLELAFSKPLKNYSSIVKSGKGIIFKTEKTSEVISAESGKVVYSGDLSNYGHVIMIDHGKDIRSVILGALNLKVKRGDFVNKGEVIGYTSNQNQDVYFELRKKEKVIQLSDYLDSNLKL